jgi:hypothetical protein
MKVFSQARQIAVVGLLVFGVAVRADSPLDVIPADAKLVVLVNNLERTTQGSEKFATAIGLTPPQNDLAPMTEMMGKLGSQWKMQKGVGIAVMQPGADGIVAVFPVDDAAETLKAVSAEMKGEFGSFDMFGSPAFGMARGKNVLVASTDNTLKSLSSGSSIASTLSAAQTKLAESSSVFVYVNVPAVKPMIDQGLLEGDQLEKGLERVAEKYPQAVKPLAQIIRGAVQLLSKDAKALFISLNVDENAAALRLGVELLPDSKARGKMAAFKSTTTDLFSSLPPTNFIMAFGADAAGIVKIDGGQNAPPLKGVSGAVSLDGGVAQAMIRIDSPEAAAIYERVKPAIGVSQVIAQTQSQGKLEFVNTTKKVGGADVSEVVVKVKGIPQQGQDALKSLLGGSDLVIQHGLVGQAIGITIGGKPDGFASLQAAGSLAASDRMKGVAALTPPNTAFAMLIDPMTVVQLVKKIARARGDEGRLAAANIPDKPGSPLGLAISIEPDGAVLHLTVPAASLKDIGPVLGQLD